MNRKVTDFLMILVVMCVFATLMWFVWSNPNSETTTKIVEAMVLIASNIATFFFTKHQIANDRD